MILAIIIGIIVWVFISSKSNNSTGTNYSSDSNYIDYQQQSKNNEKSIADDNRKQTDFQRQLQENTKTPQQVQTIKDIEETNKIYNYAKSTYETVKRELINQAQSGNYALINGNKVITYDYEYRHNPQFIGHKKEHVYINKTLLNPGGQYADKLTILITDENYYNKYISFIKEMAKNDNISIESLIIHKQNKNEIYTLPFTVQGFGVSEYHYKFVLRCNVKY